MGQETCPLAWRARVWCAGDGLLLPEDWYRSLGGPSIVFLQPTLAKLGVDSCWRKRSMRVYFVANESSCSITPRLLHVCDSFLPALDQVSGDPSSSFIQATGHQLVFLCCSLVEEEKNQLLGSLMTSWYTATVPYDSVIHWFHPVFLLELDEVLDKLNQGPSRSRLPIVDTNDTNGEDIETSHPQRRVRSKPTFKMKKSYAIDKLARFFVTGPTDASTKLSEFYCRICWKDVLVLTHGSSEVLWHFQGIRHFAWDQRLRLETPGWRVLGFDGKPLTEDELERQRDKILWAPLVVGTESTRTAKSWFRMLPEALTLNFLCSPKFRPSSMCSNWVGATKWLNVCESDLSWRPVG